MTLEDGTNKLKTLLLILNEGDFLDERNIENLFSRFSGIEKEGVRHLIVYADFLKTIDTGCKESLIRIFKEKILSYAVEFSSFSVDVIEDYETFTGTSPADSQKMSVCFVLGLGGRDELRRILSDFIIRCRNKESQPSEMTPDYISGALKLPSEPDLIISRAKHTLTDFMIWQTVYSEYYFFEKDVGRLTDSDFRKAFDSFYKRERRYGA